uniref:Uncharacterized protein n=1 Tax=Mesocestoides corti TaxID=53468 RepID=A0A5K3EMM5_MESCO
MPRSITDGAGFPDWLPVLKSLLNELTFSNSAPEIFEVGGDFLLGFSRMDLILSGFSPEQRARRLLCCLSTSAYQKARLLGPLDNLLYEELVERLYEVFLPISLRAKLFNNLRRRFHLTGETIEDYIVDIYNRVVRIFRRLNPQLHDHIAANFILSGLDVESLPRYALLWNRPLREVREALLSDPDLLARRQPIHYPFNAHRRFRVFIIAYLGNSNILIIPFHEHIRLAALRMALTPESCTSLAGDNNGAG